MPSTKPEINTADITERLVGITPAYLNNFLQRKLFGLRASVRPGKLRKKHRLFSREDVFGIALVWLLFEVGLRTDPIRRVVKDISGESKGDANLAAKKLREEQAQWVEVSRSPRVPAKTPSDKPEQVTRILGEQDHIDWFAQSDIKLFIPVGKKFKDVQHRLELLFGE